MTTWAQETVTTQMMSDSTPPLDSRARQVALTQLRRLGVQVFVTRRGGVKGRLLISVATFEGSDVAQLQAEQAFQALDSQMLTFVEPSSLAALGPVEFAGARDHGELEARVRSKWDAWWRQQQQALQHARRLAPDASFHVEPWRIEADLTHRFERVRLLFSADAARAVVVAVAGRPVSVPPAEPRAVVPVDPSTPRDVLEAVLDRAVEQAKRYAPESEDLAEAESLSLDLGTLDLSGRG